MELAAALQAFQVEWAMKQAYHNGVRTALSPIGPAISCLEQSINDIPDSSNVVDRMRGKPNKVRMTRDKAVEDLENLKRRHHILAALSAPTAEVDPYILFRQLQEWSDRATAQKVGLWGMRGDSRSVWAASSAVGWQLGLQPVMDAFVDIGPCCRHTSKCQADTRMDACTKTPLLHLHTPIALLLHLSVMMCIRVLLSARPSGPPHMPCQPHALLACAEPVCPWPDPLFPLHPSPPDTHSCRRRRR
jgi:hypothetical protein